jgi:uncharacterized membrane protein YeiH
MVQAMARPVRGASMNNDLSRVIIAADLAGTFLFAVEGALAAIAGQLDLLGVLVLSFATALGGGAMRDVLIGASPPGALRDWRYAAAAFFAGSLTFLGHGFVARVRAPCSSRWTRRRLRSSPSQARRRHSHTASSLSSPSSWARSPRSAAVPSRDVLLAHVPALLRVDIYATAAIAGAAVVVLGRGAKLWPQVASLAGGLVCSVLRVVAVWQHWHLPIASGP